MRLLKNQQAVAKDNLDTTVFLEGVAGTGKTTAAIERVKQLLREGVAAESILILVPQPTLAAPYKEALRRARLDILQAQVTYKRKLRVDLGWGQYVYHVHLVTRRL